MVSFRPLTAVVPFTNGLFKAYKWWLLTTNWDDPPSGAKFAIIVGEVGLGYPL